jgi:hypothetical protein
LQIVADSGNAIAESNEADNSYTKTITVSTTTRTWGGGSTANNLWKTKENWVGNVAPIAGDNLVFPSGAAQLESVNDYPAGTVFGSITVSGSGYRFHIGASSSISVQVQTGAQLEADSIVTGTLTIGAGATVTIAPIPGGPLAANSALTPLATDALLPNQPKIVTQPTAANTNAPFSSTTTVSSAAGPLAASTVLASPAPASSEVVSALALSGSLSKTILDAVATPTAIVADLALPVRLADSSPVGLIDTPVNRLPLQSPIYSWLDSTALQRTIYATLESVAVNKQTDNIKTSLFAASHEEFPSRTDIIEKRAYTPALNNHQAHLAALESIEQNPHWYDIEAEADFDISRHARAGKHASQLEKMIDTVLAEEEDIALAIL